MTSMTEHAMELYLNHAPEQGKHEQGAASALSAGIHDLNQQCLRILRCTAQALANSPGGLRFKAGTRPWLEGLSKARPALITGLGRRDDAVSLVVGD
ncbi:hypothetical protein [Polaromonas sp. JS666]|uniref:hypothetical protein n=1 Tax=Polaromonas sp. (strain JS666 / ATCC BAA-500) TaxID=296591 RepID=UPI00004641E6|nr:hypothetical protein [Polaromonas sp. JS666]